MACFSTSERVRLLEITSGATIDEVAAQASIIYQATGEPVVFSFNDTWVVVRSASIKDTIAAFVATREG